MQFIFQIISTLFEPPRGSPPPQRCDDPGQKLGQSFKYLTCNSYITIPSVPLHSPALPALTMLMLISEL